MARPVPAPSAAEARYRLANAWQIKRRADLAAVSYQEALRLQPDHLPACLELAALWLAEGRFDEALALCHATLTHLPESTLLRERIAEIIAGNRAGGSRGELGIRLVNTNRSASPPDAAAGTGRGGILFYMDCGGANGAGQSAHLVMSDLARAGYRVVCAQPRAAHWLIDERERLGIRHVWLRDDDLYDRRQIPLALTDGAEAAMVFDRVEPDLVFFNDGAPVSSLMAKKEAARRGFGYLILNHCVDPKWQSRFAPYVEALSGIYARAEAVVAVSNENLTLLRRLFRLPADKGTVVYNGVHDDFFAPADPSVRTRIRGELGIPDDAVVCLTTARMEVMKGYQYLLQAMEILRSAPIWPQLCFVWAGSGTLEGRLKSRAAELGLDGRVRFLGQRPDVPRLLDAADMFVLPSQFEGMPLSVIEAMAKGLPVAASSVSGTPEALAGAGELLPDPRVDPEGIVDRLVSTISLWAAEPATRKRIGADCHAQARRLFSVSDMLSAYRALVGRALETVRS